MCKAIILELPFGNAGWLCQLSWCYRAARLQHHMPMPMVMDALQAGMAGQGPRVPPKCPKCPQNAMTGPFSGCPVDPLGAFANLNANACELRLQVVPLRRPRPPQSLPELHTAALRSRALHRQQLTALHRQHRGSSLSHPTMICCL